MGLVWGDTTVSERLDSIWDVQRITAQPVQLPRHNGVALANIFN
jgi:hypothetical protein